MLQTTRMPARIVLQCNEGDWRTATMPAGHSHHTRATTPASHYLTCTLPMLPIRAVNIEDTSHVRYPMLPIQSANEEDASHVCYTRYPYELQTKKGSQCNECQCDKGDWQATTTPAQRERRSHQDKGNEATCIGLVVILAGAVSYGTVTFQKKLGF